MPRASLGARFAAEAPSVLPPSNRLLVLALAIMLLGATQAAAPDTAFVRGLSPGEAFEATTRLLNEEGRYALEADSVALQIRVMDLFTHGPVSGTFRFVEAAGGTSIIVYYDPDFEYGHFRQKARDYWPQVLEHIRRGLATPEERSRRP